jgi:hypothetical protein
MTDNKPYVSIAQIGLCKVCGNEDDLRFGACFDCSDFVAGERISQTTHRLWDSRNPTNEWFASETHN